MPPTLCLSRRVHNTRVILSFKLLAILLIILYQLTELELTYKITSPSNQLTKFEAASYKMFRDTGIFIIKVFNAKIYKGQ